MRWKDKSPILQNILTSHNLQQCLINSWLDESWLSMKQLWIFWDLWIGERWLKVWYCRRNIEAFQGIPRHSRDVTPETKLSRNPNAFWNCLWSLELISKIFCIPSFLYFLLVQKGVERFVGLLARQRARSNWPGWWFWVGRWAWVLLHAFWLPLCHWHPAAMFFVHLSKCKAGWKQIWLKRWDIAWNVSGCVILRVICLKVIWRKEGKSFLMWNISSIAVLCWELSFADRPGQKNCIVMTWSSWNIAPTRDRSMMKDIFLSRCYFTTLVSLLKWSLGPVMFLWDDVSSMAAISCKTSR